MPAGEGSSELVPDRRVDYLQPVAEGREPGVQPRVDGGQVSQRVPHLHLGLNNSYLFPRSSVGDP
jgi:hypothetical protein